MAGLQSSPLRVMRVSQLDSDLLDVELFGMLKEQLWSAFSMFNVNTRYLVTIALRLSANFCKNSIPSEKGSNQS